MRAVVVGSVMAMAGNAAAQPALTPAQPTPPAEVREDTALSIGLGTTFAAWAVVAVGVGANNGPIAATGLVAAMVAPSTGNWYAGSSGLAWLGLRVAGVAVMVNGLMNVGACEDGCSSNPRAETELLVGAGLFLAGTLADIATAPSAARRHNRELRRLSVAPMIHDGGGGLVIGGRF